jgi:ABC-type dipeptide/oligopeptide/nickel transport system permease component
MGRFIARRLGFLPITLVAVFTVVFIIAHLTPGGPWQTDLPIPKAVQAQLRAQFHASDPVPIQYLKTFADVFLHGDLGFSYRGAMPRVSVLIRNALPVSIALGLAAMMVATLLGIPLGALAGLEEGRWPDRVMSVLTLIGVSTPTYVSTPVLIVFLAVTMKWLPSAGWYGLFSRGAIIPVAALSLGPIAHIAQYTRGAVSQVKRMEHVLAAEAKGLSPIVLVWRHILRNGFASVVTVIGDDLARLIAGAFFVEWIYGIPGVGRMLVDAVYARDYPVIIGVSLVIAILISGINLLVDVCYAAIDPRVTYA